MYQTPNMNLTAWDQPDDDFDHNALAQNWLDVDQHDHDPTNSGGVQIGSGGIADNAITAAQIAPESIGTGAIQNAAVGTTQLQSGSVTNPILGPGSVFGSVIALQAITAQMLDPTLIPLGTVVMWWRPPGSGATPGGFWEAMDGRPWSSISNAWNLTTGTIPDTRGSFGMGANLTGGSPGGSIGATGGSGTINLAHSHNVNSHTHTIPSHSHGIGVSLPPNSPDTPTTNSNEDGYHYHTWGVSFSSNPEYPLGLAVTGLDTWFRTNCFDQGMTVVDYGGSQRNNVYGSLYIKSAEYDIFGEPDVNIDAPAHMDYTGWHTHGGATQGSGTLTSGASGATTDSQLGSETFAPPYVGLLYIMRVR